MAAASKEAPKDKDNSAAWLQYLRMPIAANNDTAMFAVSEKTRKEQATAMAKGLVDEEAGAQPKVRIKEGPIPHALYRTKHSGRQKLFWMDSRGRMHGKQYVGRYGEAVKYSIGYNKALGRKLMGDALARAMNPQFYFKIGKQTWSVKPEDFLGDDFDQLCKKVTSKNYVLGDSH